MERDGHVPFLGGAGDRNDDRRDPNPFVARFWVDDYGKIHVEGGKVLCLRGKLYPTAKYHHRYKGLK